MTFCPDCGTRLQLQFHPREEKDLPFCTGCGRYKYPTYNTAVSMIVTDESEKQVLLIKQYGKDSFILTAGYVNRGESAENAVIREVKEELDLDVTGLHFNRSSFFERSNTLMLNFTCTVRDLSAHPNSEVDSWQVFTREGAKAAIRPDSLAERFLLGWLDDCKAKETPKS